MRQRVRPILVVDDDPDLRDFLDLLLTAEGHDVLGVASMAEVEHTLLDCRPALMIVDPALPGEQPSAVLDRLLNLCAGGETRLLLCTGSLREARAAAAPLEARGGAVLLKPFAVEELLACIARLTYRLAQPAGCGG